MIYFAQSPAGGPVKIGYTDNLDARLKALESHYGQPLAVLATMPGDKAIESAIHARFAHLRLNGRKLRRKPEQFQPAADLMAFIGRPLLVSANPDAVETMGAKHVDIRIRVNADFYRQIKAAADKEYMTVAGFIKRAIAEHIRRQEREA